MFTTEQTEQLRLLREEIEKLELLPNNYKPFFDGIEKCTTHSLQNALIMQKLTSNPTLSVEVFLDSLTTIVGIYKSVDTNQWQELKEALAQNDPPLLQ